MPARRIAGTALALAGLAVFAWYVSRSLPLATLRPYVSARTGVAVVLAALVYATAVPCSALAWKRLLRARHIEAGFARLSGIMMTTQIGKYLPGNVGHLIGRSALAMQAGLPAGAVAGTMAYEILLLLATGVGVAVAAAALSQPGLAQLRVHGWTLAWVAVACVAAIAAMPLASRLLARVVARIAPKGEWDQIATAPPAPADLATMIVLYAGAYLAIGASAAIVSLGLWPDVRPDLALLTAAFAVAWVAGFVTPGAPAGIGVREALLVVMLGPGIGTTAATLLVLVLRIVTVLGDILTFAFGFALLFLIGRDSSTDRDLSQPRAPDDSA